MSRFSPILSGNQGHAPLRLCLVLCAASALHDLQRWWRVHKAWGWRYLHCNSSDSEFDRKAVECVLTWGEARQDWFCLLLDCCLSVSSTTNRDSLLFIWTPAQTFDLSKWVANPTQSYCGGPCGQSSNAASFWIWRRTLISHIKAWLDAWGRGATPQCIIESLPPRYEGLIVVSDV